VNERYVLHHDGMWFYYLGAAGLGAQVLADGAAMTELGRDHRAGWWAADHEAATVTISTPRHPLTIGYRLKDASTASERFPAELAVEDYEARRPQDGDVIFHLYERITQEQEPIITGDPGPWLRLEGQPRPDDGRSWMASLPYQLHNRGEYLHLFPGYMPGFRDHMQQVLKTQPRVRYVFEAKRLTQVYGLEVTLQVPFDQPVTEYRPALNRDGSTSRSRNGRTVPVMASRKVTLTVPYRIDGETRAQAAAEWNRREAELLATIASASVAACSACGGHGYVHTGGEA